MYGFLIKKKIAKQKNMPSGSTNFKEGTAYYVVWIAFFGQLGGIIATTIAGAFVWYDWTANTSNLAAVLPNTVETVSGISDVQAFSTLAFFLFAALSTGSLTAVLSHYDSTGWQVGLAQLFNFIGAVLAAIASGYSSARWSDCNTTTDVYCKGDNFIALKFIAVLGWIWVFLLVCAGFALWSHKSSLLIHLFKAKISARRAKNAIANSTSGQVPQYG